MIGGDTLRNLEDIAKITDELLEIPNVSKFVARRAVLGGFGSAVRTITGAALVGGGAAKVGSFFGDAGAITALTLAYMTRKAGDLVANPDQLRALTRLATETDAPLWRRRALLGRILEANGDVLQIAVSGPPEVTALSLNDALDNPAARFVVDFLSNEEAESLPSNPGGGP